MVESIHPQAIRIDRDRAASFDLVPVEQFFPDAAGPTLQLKTCIYSNSLDGHFIADWHPEYDRVAFAAGFSGHGFKFCGRIGEILAQMTTGKPVSFDLALFKHDRFYAYAR